MFQPSKIIKSLAFIFGVITLSLSLSYAVLAVWQEPVSLPPAGNVDTPINVGSISQAKIGDLAIQNSTNNALLKSNLLSVGGIAVVNNSNLSAIGLLVPNGNVGIGTTIPTAKLEVSDGGAAKNTSTRPLSVHGDGGGPTLHTAAFYSNKQNGLSICGALGTSPCYGYGLALGARDNDDYGSIQSGQFGDDGVLTAGGLKLILNEVGGNVGIGTANPDSKLSVLGYDGNNTVLSVLRLDRLYTGAALANGLGVAQDFYLQNSTGTTKRAARISAVWEDVTPGLEYSSIRFNQMVAGASAETVRIDNNGNVGIGTTNPAVKLEVNSALRLTPVAAPPFTCNAATEGTMYYDNSNALCVCNGVAFDKAAGAGTCS